MNPEWGTAPRRRLSRWIAPLRDLRPGSLFVVGDVLVGIKFWRFFSFELESGLKLEPLRSYEVLEMRRV